MNDAQPDHLEIDLRQMVITIANTVDLVGVDDVMHGRGVGMLAAEIARQLGWDKVAILRERVASGCLDAAVVQVVADDLDDCHRLAVEKRRSPAWSALGAS